eukprot:6142229-Amphidinium_carterae.1
MLRVLLVWVLLSLLIHEQVVHGAMLSRQALSLLSLCGKNCFLAVKHGEVRAFRAESARDKHIKNKLRCVESVDSTVI